MASVSVRGMPAVMRSLERRRSMCRAGEARLSELLQELAGHGVSVARAAFNAAASSYSGNPHVTVEVERVSPTEYRVVASGQSVLFIEFGSGVTYSTSPVAQQFGFGPLTWSTGHGNAINQNGEWIYVGQGGGDAEPVAGQRQNVWWTRGNPAANAMYQAGRDMRQLVGDVYRTVMGGGA